MSTTARAASAGVVGPVPLPSMRTACSWRAAALSGEIWRPTESPKPVVMPYSGTPWSRSRRQSATLASIPSCSAGSSERATVAPNRATAATSSKLRCCPSTTTDERGPSIAAWVTTECVVIPPNMLARGSPVEDETGEAGCPAGSFDACRDNTLTRNL